MCDQGRPVRQLAKSTAWPFDLEGLRYAFGIWDVYIVDHTFLQISAYMRDMYMYMVYDHLCVQVWASSIIVEAETLTLNLPLLKP